MLKDYFKEKGVTYTEKLVDVDEKAKEEMAQASGGFLGVPFTLITFEDGRKETVVGFDKGKINSILGINYPSAMP
jgi:glutaredoxin